MKRHSATVRIEVTFNHLELKLDDGASAEEIKDNFEKRAFEMIRDGEMDPMGVDVEVDID